MMADVNRGGFRAIEMLILADEFCFGTYPTVADIALIPQVFNARRFRVPPGAFPRSGLSTQGAVKSQRLPARPDATSYL